MKIVGIIAEYNPFHNGHAYHLKESLERSSADYSIAIMSGNFLQRGEPALYDKWTRAEIAVRNGIDLVIELPFAYACNNADYFARGALSILNGLGCVTHLSFGSENGNLPLLLKAAEMLATENPEFSRLIKAETAKGISFPKARYEALRKFGGDETASAIREPNNILAVEYLKQCVISKSDIEPITFRRFGSGYDQKNWAGSIASATAIRQKILVEKKAIESVSEVISKITLDTIKGKPQLRPIGFEDFYDILLYKILTCSAKEMEEIFSITEGLENRLIACARKSDSTASLIRTIKSKRYTETRIQRVLIHLMMNLTEEKMKQFSTNQNSCYARVLALNHNGAEIIAHIKREACAKIPIITNINREIIRYPEIADLIGLDIMASDVYNIAGKSNIYNNSDHTVKLYFKD
jgi:predicted nucleotidyltransferase